MVEQIATISYVCYPDSMLAFLFKILVLKNEQATKYRYGNNDGRMSLIPGSQVARKAVRASCDRYSMRKWQADWRTGEAHAFSWLDHTPYNFTLASIGWLASQNVDYRFNRSAGERQLSVWRWFTGNINDKHRCSLHPFVLPPPTHHHHHRVKKYRNTDDE